MRSCQQFRGKVLIVAIALIGSKQSIAASPDSPEDLGRELEALRAQVIELDRKQTAALREQADGAKNVVTAGATKGSFKLPGSNTSVTVGGYVKLDAVFSNPSAGVGSAADLFLQPNAIGV